MGKTSDKRARTPGRPGAAAAIAALAAGLLAGSALAARTDVRRSAASRPSPAEPTTFPAAPKGARITREGWFWPAKPAQPPPELPEKVTSAFILPVREPICAKTYESLQRRILWAKDKGAQLIILDMDTWGGQVHAALDIARMLKLELQDIYTVCLLRTRGLSAGALIAMACNEIVVTTVGKFGDCAPVSLGLKLEGVEREKIESLLRMEFVESAEMNSYPVALAECMVTAGREAWLVRNVRTRELRYVLKKDFRDRVRRGPRAASQPARPACEWEFLRVLVAGDELLTVHPRLALEYGFAARQIKVPAKGPPWAELIKQFHIASEPVVLDNTWPDELVLSRARPARAAILADAGPRAAPTTAPASLAAQSNPRGATPAPTSYLAAPPGAKIVTTAGEEGWFAPSRRREDPPALPAEITNAFIVPIREPIMGKTFEAMQRKVLHARSKGAQLIVFDMDTWGGDAFAALDIARMLKLELKDIYTVCFARTRAISAGALIAMACDEIVVTSVGKFGDCMPISGTPQFKLEGDRREKIETSIREEFAESAERNGYSLALSLCMVSRRLEAWLVRNVKTRELRYVLREDFSGQVRVPPGVSSAPSNPNADWEVLRTVVSNKALLTMRPSRSLEYGFARRQVPVSSDARPWAALMKEFNVVAEPTVLEDTWSETLVGFLTSPVVTSILLMGALFCLYMEINTPGFGVAGSLAIVCFAVLFGSRFLIGMAAWWEIALFVVGLVLVALEVFVTPGFGLLGISGILCCVIALLAMVVPNAPNELPIPDTDLSWSLFKTGVAALIVGAIGAVVAGALLARYLPKVPVAGRLVLAPARIVPSPTTEHAPITAVQVGEVGTVHSTCRPVGQVRFGETLVDAIADGDMLPAGAKVRVVKKEGNRIVVTHET